MSIRETSGFVEDDEFDSELSVELVQSVVREQFPHLADRSVEFLESGWSYDAYLVDGQAHTAKAQVKVTQCPNANGDHTLDEPDVRAGMSELMDRSRPDLLPGSGIPQGDSVGDRREHGAWIFRRADGSYYMVDDPFVFANECGDSSNVHSQADLNALKKSPTDSLVGHAHTHVAASGQEVFGCGVVDGIPTRRGLWDDPRVSFREQMRQPATDKDGGGNPTDWGRTDFWHVNEYVINYGGFHLDRTPVGPEVWTLQPNTPLANRAANPVHVQYRGNSNPACNWQSP